MGGLYKELEITGIGVLISMSQMEFVYENGVEEKFEAWNGEQKEKVRRKWDDGSRN